MNRITALAVAAAVAPILGLLSFATPAEARRGKREGVNFGTSIRVLGTDERTLAGEGSDKNTKTSSQSQALNPYIGYAFESFNLGLVVSAETKTSKSIEASSDGLSTTTRDSSLDGKGLSLFTRFNFGNIFFFEAGAGLYREKLEVRAETKQADEAGQFVGKMDEYQVNGTGPGYHLAGGLELPMGGDFFFSAAYQVRMVQLRDYHGGSDLGRKRSQTQKREVLFGIAHYVN